MGSEGDRRIEFRILSDVDGTPGGWRIEEDAPAAMGNTLRYEVCRSLNVGSVAMDCGFRGIRWPDYPSVHADRKVAASGLGRFASLGKIHWYEEGSYPPTCLRVRTT